MVQSQRCAPFSARVQAGIAQMSSIVHNGAEVISSAGFMLRELTIRSLLARVRQLLCTNSACSVVLHFCPPTMSPLLRIPSLQTSPGFSFGFSAG